jgi:Uri superfamily endonuclease
MKGTYVLILRASSKQRIRIGKLGRFDFDSGYYAYVGSAFGPGGVAARIGHHLGSAAKPRWHIDYLRGAMRIEEIWVSTDSVKREHEWARSLCRSEGVAVPIAGFGSSDCNCAAHLFKFCKGRRSLVGDFLAFHHSYKSPTVE